MDRSYGNKRWDICTTRSHRITQKRPGTRSGSHRCHRKPDTRPQKRQRHDYSGKKKQHTLKTQVGIDSTSKRIIAPSFSNSKRHDFRLFKESTSHKHPQIRCITDTGYIGIKKFHQDAFHPKKQRKWHPFRREDKVSNRFVSKQRVLSEYMMAY